ncbi:MAG: hypothetical protein A3B31_00445 [Candidatus Komeilibacteria bacterium RIFCSPLOWO2_01_FULL_53_11]|uniref:DUF2207 domain-containing protein n=1 Tax=Candidatus Komeilibacteria bacterium RIFCSPLOWO2_01_FULL_53_11 TaxID=1798552 RepID=A0A1G2BWW4_9BACT|nr:MAG: hypothetical protein A3B31_00445 [Candidatus Komeilibacteria bacterium RIFCSPLOWO2_01_FULL_53_11]
MKRFLVALLVIIGSGFFSVAVAQERISNFNVHLDIHADGSVRVSEAILYDFGSESRHGIFRDIPISYKTSFGTFKLRVRDIKVRYEYDLGIPFETSRVGSAIRIKIGDPDTTVTGAHTYVIRYTVDRALKFSEGRAQLVWNMTGNEWPVPIDRVYGGVVLPAPMPVSSLSSACYRGPFGSTEPCATLSAPAPSGETEGLVLLDGLLNPREGVTVSIGFPREFVSAPTPVSTVWYFFSDNWIFGVPILTFLIMWFLWHTRGRDPRGRGTIIAEYDPPEGLTPAEVGTVYDEQAENKDIAGDLIYLAIRGYLKIRQETTPKLGKDKKDYIFYRLRPADESLPDFDRELMRALFETHGTATTEAGALKEVRLSALKDKFSKDLQKVKGLIYGAVVSRGYFTKKPEWVRSIYLGIASMIWIVIYVVSEIGGLIGGVWSRPTIIVVGFITGGIIAVFGWAMPKRTYRGVLAKEHILGFREFLHVTERDRLKFHNAPEKKPETFEKFLPFAIVLGVEKEWATQFQELYTTEPQWYQGTYGARFNSVVFASSLSDLRTQAGSVMSSTPSSRGGVGGGGFSGGGFGGGGGGSW